MLKIRILNRFSIHLTVTSLVGLVGIIGGGCEDDDESPLYSGAGVTAAEFTDDVCRISRLDL